MAACQVARFYNINPAIVERWPNPDFLDRQEFMFLQMKIDSDEIEKG